MPTRLFTSVAFSRAQRYCPRSHIWVKPIGYKRTLLGLTDRGLQDIGDATAVTFDHDDVLVRIEWEALHISDGDELYHTTWANITDTKLVLSPFPSATIAKANEHLSQRIESGIESTDWLVELALDEPCERAFDAAGLLLDVDYQAAIAEQDPGLFEDNGSSSLSYTSYG